MYFQVLSIMLYILIRNLASLVAKSIMICKLHLNLFSSCGHLSKHPSNQGCTQDFFMTGQY